MAHFIRSFSRKLIPDRLHAISDRVYVFDCCLSRNEMSEADYKSYMDSVVSSLQKHHPGASYKVFNFSNDNNNNSLLSDILSEHSMTVVDYPLHYENYPLLPLEIIHYFLRSSSRWLSLESQRNVILLHCQKGGWSVLAFMLAALLLYTNKCSDEHKTLEMVYKNAPKELLMHVNSRSSQLRYLKYVSNRPHSSDATLVMDSLVLMNVPLLDGKGCSLIVLIYGQDPPRLLFSSLSTYYNEEECLMVKLDINRHVKGDIFIECKHLGEDLVTHEIVFRVMFHTEFVQSNLILSLDEIDVVWDVKSKFPEDFKAEVHFSAMEEDQAELSSEVETEPKESCYESENEFFEVEEFYIEDSITQEGTPWKAHNLPPNYTIEELGDDSESGIGLWTQNSQIMFSVESFKELYLDDDDDEEDEDGDSDASSVENIVIIDKTNEATTNSKHVVVLAVSQEQDEFHLEGLSNDYKAYENI